MAVQEFKDIEEIRAYFAEDQMATKCLGAYIDSYDWETGEVVVSMTVDDRHHNGHGFVMGGVFFTLADFALAICCNVNQERTASVASSINYMDRARGEKLIAKANADRSGRSMGFYTVDVYDELGTHIARVISTCKRTTR